MKIASQPLHNKKQTASEMYRMIKNYSSDTDKIFVKRKGQMVPFSSLTIKEAFDVVRKIPYRRDSAPVEVVTRPGIVARNMRVGMDCKKKAILLSAFLKRRGIPFRLIASSKRKDKRIHHVFPQLNFAGEWINYDATYNHYKPFTSKQVTKAEIL